MRARFYAQYLLLSKEVMLKVSICFDGWYSFNGVKGAIYLKIFDVFQKFSKTEVLKMKKCHNC